MLPHEGRFISENRASFSKEVARNVSCLKSALKIFDTDFFDDSEVTLLWLGRPSSPRFSFFSMCSRVSGCKGISCCLLQVEEMAKDAEEHNIPAFRTNRKLVASVNGGLHDPSVLVFNPDSRRTDESPATVGGFDYPKSLGVRRPKKEDDISYMSVGCFPYHMLAFLLTG